MLSIVICSVVRWYHFSHFNRSHCFLSLAIVDEHDMSANKCESISSKCGSFLHRLDDADQNQSQKIFKTWYHLTDMNVHLKIWCFKLWKISQIFHFASKQSETTKGCWLHWTQWQSSDLLWFLFDSEMENFIGFFKALRETSEWSIVICNITIV
jgi:hypothetical protein